MGDIIIVFMLGFLMGIFVTRKKYKKPLIGTLRIDNSDPDDGPYFFLESLMNPYEVQLHNYVTLKVDVNNYISQK